MRPSDFDFLFSLRIQVLLMFVTIDRSWEIGKFGKQTLKSLTTTGCSNNWLFMDNKLFGLLVLKTLTLVQTCTDIDHVNPTRTLIIPPDWNSLDFLNHIKCRTNDDRFPLPLWETWFYSTLGVPIPDLIGPDQQCVFQDFHYYTYGDHLQTC